MNKLAEGVIPALTLLLLTGCNTYSGSGIVIRKEYHPAHTEYVSAMCGNTVCPMAQDFPECYQLTVKDPHDYYDLCVKKEVYDVAKIGDTLSSSSK